MPYTSPATVVSGTGITAGWGNSVKAATDYLANAPGCRVYSSVNLLIPDNSGTLLTFNSERFDNDNMHSTSINTGRITFNTEGVYVVTFNGLIQAAADYTLVWAKVRLNGTSYIAGAGLGTITDSGHNMPISVATIYKFAAGAYIDVLFYHNNSGGTSRNVLATAEESPEFAAHWLGRG